MFDPASLTLGQISSALRDFTVVGVLVTIAWKSRGLYEGAKDFLDRLTNHMTVMETGMEKLLENHLVHIQQDLSNMAHRQVRASDAEQASYSKFDQASPE